MLSPGVLVRTGKLTAEIEALVEQLKATAADAPPALEADLVNGTFHSLLNSTNYLADDCTSTLGTLTFQQFAPKDLKVVTVIASILFKHAFPCLKSAPHIGRHHQGDTVPCS